MIRPPLPLASLAWHCDPEQHGVQGTDRAAPAAGIVGQDSAVDALRFGLEIDAPGQNVFVRGLVGTGRLSLVRELLEEIQPACPLAPDRCYVFRANAPERPRLVTLPRGQAVAFADAAERLGRFIRSELPELLAQHRARPESRELDALHRRQIDDCTRPFEASLREDGLTLVRLERGELVMPAVMPVRDGEPLDAEALAELVRAGTVSEEEQRALHDKVAAWTERLGEVTATLQSLRDRHGEAMAELQRAQAGEALRQATQALRERFPQAEVLAWADDVCEHASRHLQLLHADGAPDITQLYAVNVLRSAEDEQCPVLVENQPTRDRLVGGLQLRRGGTDEPLAPHMQLGGGSLLRADGGYLVLESRDLFSEEGAWDALVRTLRAGSLDLLPGRGPDAHAAPVLQPDPIPVRVKVVLLGDRATHAALDQGDPDFPNLFKVVADFDDSVPRDADGVALYAGVLARIANEEGLPVFDAGAVAALCEHGVRMASEPGRLTARFGRVADLAREAAYLCSRASAPRVAREHVVQAVRRARDRADLPARRFARQLAADRLALTTRGRAVGQTNGLAVIHTGSVGHGFPARITASVGPGQGGTVNIEGEAGLSGAIHTKAFLILGGLIRNLLRTPHPLVFDASLAFEQSYGGIDGDSASAVQVCCLLSAMTDLPVRQDVAMTGAIDQLGNVLPIGGVNEKIEGFHDACVVEGQLDAHGVIIPAANVGDLQLAPRVLEAAEAGTFRVWAVDRIEDALAILFDREAGTRDADGRFPPDSVLGVAVARARAFWESLEHDAAPRS